MLSAKPFTLRLLQPLGSLSGVMILGAMLLALGGTFNLIHADGLATLLAWGFVIAELPQLAPRQLRLLAILCGIGVAFAGWAWLLGGRPDPIALLGEHLKLAMILAAVNFIRLVSKPEPAPDRKGLRSFLTTLGGMHFFSAVANFSSVVMVGDQLHRGGSLSRLSQILLSRGFSLAVLWSPFLSILPMILDKVPGSNLYALYPFMIALALLGLIVTLVEARLLWSDALDQYAGYPLKRATLTLPGLLIVSVLLITWLAPELPTLGVVSVMALLTPVALLTARNGLAHALKSASSHTRHRLPDARGEIALFLSAGLLAAGVKSFIALGLIQLPLEETNATIASLVLICVLAGAYLGIHQFALIAIFIGLLADITTTPTLMGIAYIAATSLSMSGSVFSGLNFILQARFHCPASHLLRQNLVYTLVMLVATLGLLHLLETWGVR